MFLKLIPLNSSYSAWSNTSGKKYLLNVGMDTRWSRKSHCRDTMQSKVSFACVRFATKESASFTPRVTWLFLSCGMDSKGMWISRRLGASSHFLSVWNTATF